MPNGSLPHLSNSIKPTYQYDSIKLISHKHNNKHILSNVLNKHKLYAGNIKKWKSSVWVLQKCYWNACASVNWYKHYCFIFNPTECASTTSCPYHMDTLYHEHTKHSGSCLDKLRESFSDFPALL